MEFFEFMFIEKNKEKKYSFKKKYVQFESFQVFGKNFNF